MTPVIAPSTLAENFNPSSTALPLTTFNVAGATLPKIVSAAGEGLAAHETIGSVIGTAISIVPTATSSPQSR
jgi:hypothetical protein